MTSTPTTMDAKRILVVEDSPTQREGLQFVLEDAGFAVVTAANGKEGLLAARAHAVDLVISDVMMPEMDGYEFCKALRADEALRHIPVILLTSLTDASDVIRALESGARSFLRKPFEAAYLPQVRNVLETAALRAAGAPERGLTVRFRGKRYRLSPDRMQILEALLATRDDDPYPLTATEDRSIDGARVLLVEDSVTQAREITDLLENEGCVVVTAANGREGLAALETSPFDVVLSDIVMPEMDGYSFCRAIRADPRFRDVPVILLTFLTDLLDVVAGLEAGATNFMRKPVDGRTLGSRVRNLLAGRLARATRGFPPEIDIVFKGEHHAISAEPSQMVDLLLSSYATAVQQNTDLAQARDDLHTANEQLETRVGERTAALTAEIEERKRAEKLAAERSEQLRFVTDHAPVLIAQCDLERRYKFANQPYAAKFGLEVSDLLGKHPKEVLGEDAYAQVSPYMDAALAGRHAEGDLHLPLAAGGPSTVHASYVPERDASGQVLGFIAAIVDVTTRRRDEKALALRSRIASLFLGVPDHEMFREVLKVVLDVVGSPFGVFGYLDEAGALVVPTMTTRIRNEGEVSEESITFPKETWGDGTGPAAIREKKSNYSNQVSTMTPPGNVIVQRHISVPILFQGEVIGLFQVANKETDYTGSDVDAVEAIAGQVAPLLSARLRGERLQEGLRSSLGEKEALLKEVHHRVKNNLQVISSLLRMEARRIADPTTQSVLKSMQNRVLSMACLHETLYRSGDFAHVDLGAYLKEVINKLGQSMVTSLGQTGFRLDLAPVMVDLEQAIPCGLIVNELVSNALKHAFPDGRSGEIRVELSHADGAKIRLRVSDTGVGLPPGFDEARQFSLGLQLVSDLARQLTGSLRIAPAPEASFEVTFG